MSTMMPRAPEHNPPDAPHVAQCGSTSLHEPHWCAGLDGTELHRSRGYMRTRLARVVHDSEHHPDGGECPGQCYATAERVLEALDGER